MIGQVMAAFLLVAPAIVQAASTAQAVASEAGPPWSPDLGDPVLADLLVRAELGSLDIRMALARLERAGADVDLARAGQRPHLTIGAVAAVGGADFSSTANGAGVPVLGSYEVDLFGRLKQAQRAAAADQTAALADAAAARQLVLAQVARAYVTLRGAQAHQAAAEESLRLSEQVAQLMRHRRDEGVVLAVEVSAGEIQTAQARANVQVATHAVEAQCIRLGVLLGLDGPIAPPALSGDDIPLTRLVTSVPSEAVLMRADIQAAQARLQAADARRAEAVAASRPRFTLTAGIGSGETDLLYLLDVRALAWSIAGGLTHELFDGGAGKARKRGARADYQIAELTYRKTVGEAWGQARLELAALQDAAASEVLADKAWGQAVTAFGAGQARHAEGDIDGLALARLEAQALSADTALADARAARAKAFIDLSLALGGQTP